MRACLEDGVWGEVDNVRCVSVEGQQLLAQVIAHLLFSYSANFDLEGGQEPYGSPLFNQISIKAIKISFFCAV